MTQKTIPKEYSKTVYICGGACFVHIRDMPIEYALQEVLSIDKNAHVIRASKTEIEACLNKGICKALELIQDGWEWEESNKKAKE